MPPDVQYLDADILDLGSLRPESAPLINIEPAPIQSATLAGATIGFASIRDLVILLVPFVAKETENMPPETTIPKSYVHVDCIVKGISGALITLCVASLIISGASKIDLINPFFAILLLVSALSFRIMPVLAKRHDLIKR